jgi:hypothetical protein
MTRAEVIDQRHPNISIANNIFLVLIVRRVGSSIRIMKLTGKSNTQLHRFGACFRVICIGAVSGNIYSWFERCETGWRRNCLFRMKIVRMETCERLTEAASRRICTEMKRTQNARCVETGGAVSAQSTAQAARAWNDPDARCHRRDSQRKALQ